MSDMKKELQTRLTDATHDADLSAAISMVICENVGYQSLPERNVAEIVSAAKASRMAELAQEETETAHHKFEVSARDLSYKDEEILRREIGAYAPFFDFLDFLIEKSDYTKGAYISGDVGCAKSHHIVSRMVRYGLDFVVINTAITPLALYRCLYENQNKTVVFDDVVGLFEPKAMAVLRSALFSVSGVRMVRWQSTAKVLEEQSIPQSFVFSGHIIVVQNKAERGMKEELQALISRMYSYDLRLTLEEKRKLMRIVLGTNDFFGLPKLERDKLLVFMESIASFGNSARYNLRTGIQAAEIWAKLGEEKAKPMILELLETDIELVKFLTIEEQGADLPVARRVDVFKRLSGRSRRGYFDIKKKYRQSLHNRADLSRIEIESVMAELKAERGVKYIGGHSLK